MNVSITMRDRSCPLCGSMDQSRVLAEAKFNAERLNAFAFASRKLPEYMHHRMIACAVCDVVYASPLPTLESLIKAYEEAAFDTSRESCYASLTYRRFLPGIVKHLSDRVGAIDIGTGDGAFLDQLLAEGFSDVVGVEPSKAPIESAQDHIRPLIRCGPFELQPGDEARFRLVTCFQTLEHLYDPMEMCRNAYKILKNGGAVFLICHNRRSFSTKLLGTKSPIFDIEHLQLFSSKSARYMLEQAGFVSVKIKTVFNRYPLHYWVKLFPIPMNLKSAVISILKKTGVGYMLLSIPAGNIAVIGYKKG